MKKHYILEMIKTSHLSKDLGIYKYSEPNFKKGNEELMKKILTERC